MIIVQRYLKESCYEASLLVIFIADQGHEALLRT